MTRGSVTKLVNTFGSTWGRIKPEDGVDRQVFFNGASLAETVEFASIGIGQDVEFDEEMDQVNGSHAEHLVLVAAVAAK
jgi:cold shock CspA family protein